jgi:hypothetical protein
MKMSKVSPEKLEKARKRLVEVWNKGVACKMPSKQAIRNRRNELQRLRKKHKEFVSDQDELIKETLEQEKIVREYLGGSDETESVRPEFL